MKECINTSTIHRRMDGTYHGPARPLRRKHLTQHGRVLDDRQYSSNHLHNDVPPCPGCRPWGGGGCPGEDRLVVEREEVHEGVGPLKEHILPRPKSTLCYRDIDGEGRGMRREKWERTRARVCSHV